MQLTAVCVGVLALAGAASGDLAVLSAAKDATLYQATLGDVANGSGEYLFVGNTNTPSKRRALIAFDVAGSIPAGSTINSVTLRMRVSRTIAPSQPVGLYLLQADWSEGPTNAAGNEGTGDFAQAGDVTWLHRTSPGVLWATPGGDFAATASATTNVVGTGFYTWSGAGLVADVQTWLAAPATNYGWAIVGNEATDPTSKRFDSRTSLTPANRPTLTVDFTPPPPPSCAGDTNGDNQTDGADLSVLLGQFGQSVTPGTGGDLNDDGLVNAADLSVLLSDFGCV